MIAMEKIKCVFISTDGRFTGNADDDPVPSFAAGDRSLMQGMAPTPEIELHVVSCTQRPMKSPERVADNVWFHSLLVPKFGWLRTFYQGCIRAMRKKIHEINP